MLADDALHTPPQVEDGVGEEGRGTETQTVEGGSRYSSSSVCVCSSLSPPGCVGSCLLPRSGQDCSGQVLDTPAC